MLRKDQIEQFQADGYVLIAKFFSDREITALRKEVARFAREGLLRNVATQGDGETQTEAEVNLQLVPIAPHSELFRALPFSPKVTEAVGDLLGAPVVKILDQLFCKPARRGLPTNWYTDNAYFQISDPLKGCAMWIALDDATRENGTLKVIPGVFRDQFDHFRDPASDHHIRMDAQQAAASHCELAAGGVVFFCFGTPHATGPNRTDSDRTGIGIHFVNGAYLNDRLGSEGRAEYLIPMTETGGQQNPLDDLEQADVGGHGRDVAVEQLLLVVDHAAGAATISCLGSGERGQQLAGPGRRLGDQQVVGHVPLLGAADREHLGRQRGEFGPRGIKFVEALELLGGQQVLVFLQVAKGCLHFLIKHHLPGKRLRKSALELLHRGDVQVKETREGQMLIDVEVCLWLWRDCRLLGKERG